MGTKQRILTTSQALFNSYGIAAISSLQIASELGISPGNLYYHFRGKDEILVILLEQCEQALADSGQRFAETVSEPQQQWPYLHSLVQLCLNYRFIFRNIDFLSRDSPALARRLRLILRRLRQLTEDMLQQLQSQKLLTIPPEQQKLLADNLLLLALGWIQYQELQGPLNQESTADGEAREAQEAKIVHQGCLQLMSALTPYLTRSETVDR